MKEITVGTTPTIIWNFPNINPLEIEIAVMTIERAGQIIFEKDMISAIIGEKSLSWKLSQAETLGIGVGFAELALNWMDIHGTRGTGKPLRVSFVRNPISEVMGDG